MPKKRKNVLAKVEEQTGHTAREWLSVFARLAVAELEGVEPELARIFRRGQTLLRQVRDERLAAAVKPKRTLRRPRAKKRSARSQPTE